MFDINVRDDIAQEMRIKIWKYLTIRLPVDASVEEMEKYITDYFYSISWLSSKQIYRKKIRDDKRYVQCGLSVGIEEAEYSGNEIEKKLSTDVDISKYADVLSKKELVILKYILDTENDFSNFDSLSRQLGYTGKGSSKYNIKKIVNKIT